MSDPFQQLEVWRLAYDLALRVYKVTAHFPKSETYGLTSQLRRAAVAIATNIAEGNARKHLGEYLQFCYIARGSTAEMKCLLHLSGDLQLLSSETFEMLNRNYGRVGAMLQALINRLSRKPRVNGQRVGTTSPGSRVPVPVSR